MEIPRPEPGLVVHFDYLWKREAQAGRREARYPRPCAIVVAHRDDAGALLVMLVPITHSPPQAGQAAIEVPPAVKRHLGLDEARSWIVVDEVNETGWPGFDLREAAPGQAAYGFIPPKLFIQVRNGMIAAAREGRLGRTRR